MPAQNDSTMLYYCKPTNQSYSSYSILFRVNVPIAKMEICKFLERYFRGICSLASVFMKNRVQRSVNRNEKKSKLNRKVLNNVFAVKDSVSRKNWRSLFGSKYILVIVFFHWMNKNRIWHLSRNTKEISLVARKCLVVNFRLQSQQWRTRLNKKETKPNLCLGFI